ncbi:histidine triad nucleotide-binding protein [Desulfobulbus alkaliphilus]|uniref:histidine triad nucleotide-binding protein n=1 Tax=Desulfobulbus alkaliphilus TaxID=869814 RepID=UPI0019656CCF|nr:histidine triad nucleotide-binding protein [Desulfobulbus alkaliphilus]MBM9536899.1 histidine triad nucleotide-binding protein [Desulfobulbus alkaliphilus]
MSENCLFCKIVEGEIPVTILYEDEDIIAFNDINPQAPIHFLLIPKKHLSGPEDVAIEDERVAGKLMRMGNEIALQEGCSQYRVVVNNGPQAGQTVFHLHMHILGGRDMSWPPG